MLSDYAPGVTPAVRCTHPPFPDSQPLCGPNGLEPWVRAERAHHSVEGKILPPHASEECIRTDASIDGYPITTQKKLSYRAPFESWSRKSEQSDKWSFCLTAGTLCPANQERP